jgi:hypothetical protein
MLAKLDVSINNLKKAQKNTKKAQKFCAFWFSFVPF